MKKAFKNALFGLVLAPILTVNTAISLPSSDIFLAKIENGKVSSIKNITEREGYDNQPNFIDDGLLYTAAFKQGEQWQTDAMYYDFNTQQTSNLTNTAVSEYSPTKVPHKNAFSVILQGLEGSQELWQYSFDKDQAATLLRKEVGKIGYHAWGQNNDLITFILGEPHVLYFGNTDKQTGREVAQNIGRTLAYNSSLDMYSFSQYQGKDLWVTLFDDKKETLKPLLKLPQGVDYYAWHGDDALIYAQGNTLYFWQLGSTKKATKWLDLSEHCTGKITRLKYQTTSQYLAFVCE